MTIESSIKDEIKYCQQKAVEYRKNEKKKTANVPSYWEGKADTHEYIAIRLQRVLDWHSEASKKH